MTPRMAHFAHRLKQAEQPPPVPVETALCAKCGHEGPVRKKGKQTRCGACGAVLGPEKAIVHTQRHE